jgi:hypothetical protein
MMQILERINDINSVAIWLDERGVPARIVWEGKRWRVSDTPTELDLLVGSMHPSPVHGWRFQATSEIYGVSRVFDVAVDATTDRWRLLRVWD